MGDSLTRVIQNIRLMQDGLSLPTKNMPIYAYVHMHLFIFLQPGNAWLQLHHTIRSSHLHNRFSKTIKDKIPMVQTPESHQALLIKFITTFAH